MKAQLLALVLVTAHATTTAAQTTVYESRDAQGNTVFSDKPSPGAKAIELPQPNVIQTDLLPPPPAQAAPVSGAGKKASIDADATPVYSSLAIASPGDQDSIYTNTGAFDVTLKIDPDLRTNQGDFIQLKLDGTLVPQQFSAPDISISSADWAASATDNTAHTLQAAILDKQGKILIESAPVTFYAHRHSIL
ncbi:MAG TPA: DUF4124 domain-containing protein [Methylophilaceae bacterium]|nr:DUF4124 domain-containing protein [Methylophilaceae bacterium]HQR60184.1 DUF4124 domain-containing protein [Methylophilaceae bacterium]